LQLWLFLTREIWVPYYWHLTLLLVLTVSWLPFLSFFGTLVCLPNKFCVLLFVSMVCILLPYREFFLVLVGGINRRDELLALSWSLESSTLPFPV
jgi:hypothetical protein